MQGYPSSSPLLGTDMRPISVGLVFDGPCAKSVDFFLLRFKFYHKLEVSIVNSMAWGLNENY